MTEADFNHVIREILDAETSMPRDWATVERLSLNLTRDQMALLAQRPSSVTHFVDDFDLRRKDDAYARQQREAVRAYLAGVI
ncbi:hypothetical protein [Brevundimonas sp.]|uniref:hypothetical protein n=1 Tax=Brevundimonas sp. TaxID=1871086 RepID=UPI003BAC4319